MLPPPDLKWGKLSCSHLLDKIVSRQSHCDLWPGQAQDEKTQPLMTRIHKLLQSPLSSTHSPSSTLSFAFLVRLPGQSTWIEQCWALGARSEEEGPPPRISVVFFEWYPPNWEICVANMWSDAISIKSKRVLGFSATSRSNQPTSRRPWEVTAVVCCHLCQKIHI